MEAKLNSYEIIAKGCTVELVNRKNKAFYLNMEFYNGKTPINMKLKNMNQIIFLNMLSDIRKSFV